MAGSISVSHKMKEKNRGAKQQAKKKTSQSWFYSTIRDSSTLCCFWSIPATKVTPTWQSHLCLHFDFKSTRHDSVSMNRTEVFVKFDWRIYRLRKLTPLLTEGKCGIIYGNMYYMYISVSISAVLACANAFWEVWSSRFSSTSSYMSIRVHNSKRKCNVSWNECST